MKSLYESILDIDDTKLDKNSINAILTKYGIKTRGSGKNTVVTTMIYLKYNDKKEVVPYTWSMYSAKVSANDIPSFSELFPDGATLSAVGRMYKDDEIALSELPKNIKVQMCYINSVSTMNILDVEVGSVCLNGDHNKLLKTSSLNNISRYTDTLKILQILPNTMGIYTGYEDLLDIKNCPFKNIVMQYGARLFGLNPPRKQDVTIQKYLTYDKLEKNGEYWISQYSDPSGQKSEFAQKVKNWIENNPKTTLIMSWGEPFEKVSMEGDKLVATKMSQAEINKLIK